MREYMSSKDQKLRNRACHPQMQDIKKFEYIDTLRGLAVLAVLGVHCSQHGSHPCPGWFGPVVIAGQFGIQLFYVVSALTLCLSMNARMPLEKKPVLNFFIRRFFRIAPLFYLAMVYYLWQNGLGPRYWLGNAPAITRANILSTATFTNSLNPYWINSVVDGGWTVAVEMSFYLFLPYLYYKLNNLRKALWFTLVSLAASWALVWFMSKNPLISDHRLWKEYLYFFFPEQLPVFILGIVLFHWIKNSQATAERQERECPVSFSNVLRACSALLLVESVTGCFIPQHFKYAVAFVLLAYSLYLKSPKWLVNRLTVFLGKISFSLYLTHFGVLHFMDHRHLTDFTGNGLADYFIRYFLLVGIAVIVSVITYRLVELPGQNIGKKIINKLSV